MIGKEFKQHLENVPQKKTEDIPFQIVDADVCNYTKMSVTMSPFNGDIVPTGPPTVRYAKRHGYDFRCDVLPAKEMLDAIAPRDAHTWYKAGRNTDDAVDAVCHGCMDAYD